MKINKDYIVPFFLLLLLTLIIRLPFFFYSHINWDEAPFVVLGQDLLDGHLPYTHLWAAKPPLTFVSFAFFIFLFGKSLVAIRLGGFLCVFISSYVLFLIGKRVKNNATGLWAGLLNIIFATTMPSGGATMSEHLTLVPIALVLYLLIVRPINRFNIVLSGVLVSIAFLMRNNMIYALLPLFFIIYFNRDKRSSQLSMSYLLLTCGFLFLPIMCVLVYAITGHLDALFAVAFKTATSYSSDFQQTIWGNVYQTFHLFGKYRFLQNFFIVISFGAAVYVFLVNESFGLKKAAITCALFFVAILVSIVHAGRGYGHYFIQLIPVMSLLAGGLIAIVFKRREPHSLLGLILIIISLMVPLRTITRAYTHGIFASLRQQRALFNDEGYQVINFLNSHDLSGQYIFILYDPIGYWLTDGTVPTALVHPVDFFHRSFLKIIGGPQATFETEIQKIFEKNPMFVVKYKKLDFLGPKQNEYLDDIIAKKYVPVKQIKDIMIFKINDTPKK